VAEQRLDRRAKGIGEPERGIDGRRIAPSFHGCDQLAADARTFRELGLGEALL
jgi:hypothetical protein